MRYSEDGTQIKACQGHSVSWVEPELSYREPPAYLYHGTTADAYRKILDSGHISKMGRHAVQMQAEEANAWQSAKRWRRIPVVLKIDAGRMHADYFVFGITDNGVWCTKRVSVEYIACVLRNNKNHMFLYGRILLKTEYQNRKNEPFLRIGFR